MVPDALGCRLVTSQGDQTTTDANPRSVPHHVQTPTSILGSLTVSLVAFLGFMGLWISTSGPAVLTILHVSILIALCLLLGGLSRWISGSYSHPGRLGPMAGSDVDMTERKREEALQAAEKQALELVAKGATLNDVLACLCRTIEGHTPQMFCSVMLVSEDRTHLRSAAAPSLPDEYNRAVDGMLISPTVGACGTAANVEKPLIASDIATDPLWNDYAAVAMSHGLKACWSQPIIGSTGTLLGLFAAYYREVQKPQPDDLNIMERVSHIAARAIEHATVTEALRESESRFQAFMHHSPAMTFIRDEVGRHLYINSKFESLFGVSKEEIKHKTVFDFMPADVAARIHQNDQAVFSTGRTLEIEETVPALHGTAQHWLVIKFPLDIGQGRLLGGVAIDITERKRADEYLRRTRFAMDQAVDAVYWIDPQAKILYANDTATAMLGYTTDEFLRMTVHDLNPNFPQEMWPGFWAETREKRVMSFETIHLAKDGRRIPIDIRVSFLAYGGQEFHCAFVRDITERKRADEALRASRERFELAARATNDGIWDWNIVTGGLYWSDRTFELLGLESGALTPSYDVWISVVHPDDVDRAHRAVSLHLDMHEPYDIEIRVRMKDGSYRWFRDLGQAVWDATGRPVRMVGSMSDVTERRIAEEALRAAHAELERRVHERTMQLELVNRSLQDEVAERKRAENVLRLTQFTVDRAAHGIFWVGPNAEILYVNDAACDVLGYSRDELLRMMMHDIDPNFPPEAWPALWEELKRRGSFTFESSPHTKGGGVRYTEVTVNYLEYESQAYNCAIVRDITERKCAEEALRESELRYKLLTEATFDGIAIHDQGVLFEVNTGLERMFGYGPGELIGRSILDLVADESRAQIVANMRHGVSGPYEAMGRRKDGTTFPGEVVVRPYSYRGKEVRLVAGRDITERKEMEARLARHAEELEQQVAERTSEIAKLEAHRAQAEKLAAIGRLAAGVAHEINNPIAGIKNAFTLVKQAVDPAHPHAEFADMIDREIVRVASIVQNMYQLYRRESSHVEAVEIQTMLGDIQALFAKQLQQRQLTLMIDVEPVCNRLTVPRGDLLQILLNLLSNAIDCSSEGGVITLTIREESDVVRIAVLDQGTGIDPDVVPHIFDPFFTTKTEGEQKGMGLGLAVSQSLVAAMGGTIEVQTQPNRGSTFSILLPRHAIGACRPDQVNTIKEVVTYDH